MSAHQWLPGVHPSQAADNPDLYDVENDAADPDRLLEAAMWAIGVLAGWRSVTPIIRFPVLAGGAMALHLSLERAQEHRTQRWMHRPVDVVRAVSDRGWPADVAGSVDFRLTDPLAAWNSGNWRLEVGDGHGELTRVSVDPPLELSVRGFARLYCGVSDAATLAQAGLITALGGHSPVALDLLGSGPAAELIDYF
jgi:hypothetical protein